MPRDSGLKHRTCVMQQLLAVQENKLQQIHQGEAMTMGLVS